jgi:hypothetical protein
MPGVAVPKPAVSGTGRGYGSDLNLQKEREQHETAQTYATPSPRHWGRRWKIVFRVDRLAARGASPRARVELADRELFAKLNLVGYMVDVTKIEARTFLPSGIAHRSVFPRKLQTKILGRPRNWAMASEFDGSWAVLVRHQHTPAQTSSCSTTRQRSQMVRSMDQLDAREHNYSEWRGHGDTGRDRP